MSKTFTKLTRPAMRKLAAGDKLNEHGIAFERHLSGWRQTGLGAGRPRRRRPEEQRRSTGQRAQRGAGVMDGGCGHGATP